MVDMVRGLDAWSVGGLVGSMARGLETWRARKWMAGVLEGWRVGGLEGWRGWEVGRLGGCRFEGLED
jgi:hypothetical protein